MRIFLFTALLLLGFFSALSAGSPGNGIPGVKAACEPTVANNYCCFDGKWCGGTCCAVNNGFICTIQDECKAVDSLCPAWSKTLCELTCNLWDRDNDKECRCNGSAYVCVDKGVYPKVINPTPEATPVVAPTSPPLYAPVTQTPTVVPVLPPYTPPPVYRKPSRAVPPDICLTSGASYDVTRQFWTCTSRNSMVKCAYSSSSNSWAVYNYTCEGGALCRSGQKGFDATCAGNLPPVPQATPTTAPVKYKPLQEISCGGYGCAEGNLTSLAADMICAGWGPDPNNTKYECDETVEDPITHARGQCVIRAENYCPGQYKDSACGCRKKGITCGPIDVDGNGILDAIDYAAFALVYNKQCADTCNFGGCGAKDTNGDGVVNYIDLASFARRYHTVASSCLLNPGP